MRILALAGGGSAPVAFGAGRIVPRFGGSDFFAAGGLIFGGRVTGGGRGTTGIAFGGGDGRFGAKEEDEDPPTVKLPPAAEVFVTGSLVGPGDIPGGQ